MTIWETIIGYSKLKTQPVKLDCCSTGDSFRIEGDFDRKANNEITFWYRVISGFWTNCPKGGKKKSQLIRLHITALLNSQHKCNQRSVSYVLWVTKTLALLWAVNTCIYNLWSWRTRYNSHTETWTIPKFRCSVPNHPLCGRLSQSMKTITYPEEESIENAVSFTMRTWEEAPSQQTSNTGVKKTHTHTRDRS